MWQACLSVTDIAEEMEVSRTTVYWWINRWKNDGSLLTRPRSGRPRVTTREEEARIAETVRDNPDITPENITHQLKLSCCPATTRKGLRKNSGVQCSKGRTKRAKSEQVIVTRGRLIGMWESDIPIGTIAEEQGMSRQKAFYHQPPAPYHQPPAFYHKPPSLDHQPPAFYHKPPALYPQPLVPFYHQSPALYHQPPAFYH
ncbi:hypothetical protein Pcinc_019672 [Petrolisthes cinctipes]|uniref:Uncharacterized protein n=1 Tax=Petrolisthes cinctipes TaxID=88211 RepID=A0AAE1FJR0_PETCI|nr:hypothetical protein Pcinc_019672 [Petrolisthes cinctipes]